MTVGLDFLSTGPNWTSPGNVPGSAMLPVVLHAGPLTGQEHPLLLVGGGYSSGTLKDMWVLDVDREVWSGVSELISLVYDELYQECMLYVCAFAYIYVAVCLESLV